MSYDPFDFLAFQNRLLMSLQKHAPLQECLRELMASILGKLMDYTKVSMAMHLFVNTSLGEAHVMVLCRGTEEWKAVEDLALHRDGVLKEIDHSRLPEYRRAHVPGSSKFYSSLCTSSVPYEISPPRELVQALVDEGDLALTEKLIVVPLSTGEFSRLGALLLWNSPECDAESLFMRQQMMVGFGRDVSRLFVRVFCGLYKMQPFTYLPTYYCPERKSVALFCAQMRHFGYIARTLDSRKHMDDDVRRACLQKLVNRFSETVADVVEIYKGRIDQLWGGGLLAVFGEYIDSSEDARISSCMRAIQAAAEAVSQFEKAKDKWLKEDFEIGKFQLQANHYITTSLAVAVTFGEVEFDYLGSRDHRVFMSFGDQVSLVKQLVTRAGQTELDEKGEREDAPILATQQVFGLTRDACIQDAPSKIVGSVDKKILVRLPGRPAVIPVFGLWPDNVRTGSS